MEVRHLNELEAISAEVIGVLGDDLHVVNAARVTMGVNHLELAESDTRLIKFLAREGHVTPFRHPTITLRCKAPIAIARQLSKHQSGFSWNEKSRRYKDGDVEIYIPSTLRKRPSDLHSGSDSAWEPEECIGTIDLIKAASRAAVQQYSDLLSRGVAPEQARFVLPQNMVTEWVWTGSLYGWFSLFKQRTTEHAQHEAQIFASKVDMLMKQYFPISWEALKGTIKHD